MSDHRYEIIEHQGVDCLHVMIDPTPDMSDDIAHTRIPIDSIMNSYRIYRGINGTYGDLDEVDARMQSLGAALNLADPDGTFSSKGYRNDTEQKVWQAVLKGYRKLSDAILALRKDT